MKYTDQQLSTMNFAVEQEKTTKYNCDSCDKEILKKLNILIPILCQKCFIRVSKIK